ncbi:MAG: HD domain-containing protein [Candidatus Pacebacteria bacterium]|nr:HD domain-containing protein [Candidatus Paceibacterota bacterium]
MKTIPASKIPKEINDTAEVLEGAGFEAYLVGGCVRDLLLGKAPKDWDFATDATPEDIQGLFEETFYENDFGTVGVVLETQHPTLKVLELTPYRLEGSYSDARRPDEVHFSKNLKDDLKRRDFTINAIAFRPKTGELVDLFNGSEDIKRKSIVAVGDPNERFEEDALRMLRAIRLSAELNFTIDPETANAIVKNATQLGKISKERIRDEFLRILASDTPMHAIVFAQKLGLLPYIAPDLERGIGVEQNQAHKYDVFEHLLRTMQHGADMKWSVDIRLAGLYHDISKPETRRWSEEKGDWTFHGHEVVGARIAKKAFNDLKLPKKQVEKLVKLVRWHMFFSDPEKITLSAVRRMIRNVGEENIWDLLNLRICDRIGSGRPKAQPFRFRKYKSMVDEALRDPTSVGMLKIDGAYIMQELSERPGPRIGYILHALLEEVLDDPSRNTEEYLGKRARELTELPEETLRTHGEDGKRRREKFEEEAVAEIRKKHHVQ